MKRLLLFILVSTAIASILCCQRPSPELLTRPDAGSARAARPVMAALAGAGLRQFYDNLGAINEFHVLDPVYGGICNGVADDTAALNAAESDRNAKGGVLVFPPSICRTASLISANAGAVWRGVPGSSVLQSSATMDAVSSFTGQSSVAGIIFDGNRLAKQGILELGDQGSRYTECQFNNALGDGARQAQAPGPATISAVTQTGGGPSVTISQLEPYRAQLGGTNNVLKISVAGALGTAKFVLSTDGGATFTTAAQSLFATTQIGYPVAPSFVTNTGMIVNAAAGVYQLNTTYAYTITTAINLNNYVTYDHCTSLNDGSTYASAGFVADYPLGTYNTITAPGTISLTAGSQIATGVGTTWLTGMPGSSDGDSLRVSGKRYMISAVLSDTQLALDLGNLPTTSPSGVDWAISIGAGDSVDTGTGNQEGVVLDHWRSLQCATGMRFSGLGGPLLLAPYVRFPAITSIMIGTAFIN